MYQQEDEQTAGETECVQGRNKQCAFARDTEAKLLLSHAQMCAQQFCRKNRDTGRRNKTTARLTTCSKRHVSARVIHSFCHSRCGALAPTAVGDYLISEQQDAHVAFSLQDSFLINNTVDRYCFQQLCKTRKETKGEHLHLLALPANTSGTDGRKQKTSRCAGPAHQQKDVFGLRTKTVRRKTGATGSRDTTRT